MKHAETSDCGDENCLTNDRIEKLPKWARQYIRTLEDRVKTAELTIPWTQPGMEWFTLLRDSEPEKLFLLSKDGAHCIACIGRNDIVFVGRGKKPPETPLFLLQNCTAGYVGNSPVFWQNGGSGYTPWINEAKRWTQEEAEKTIRATRGTHTWRMWPVSEIEAAAKQTVDIQDLRKKEKT